LRISKRNTAEKLLEFLKTSIDSDHLWVQRCESLAGEGLIQRQRQQLLDPSRTLGLGCRLGGRMRPSIMS
jgi:hypothetical protein